MEKCFQCISALCYTIVIIMYNSITVLKAPSLALMCTVFIKKKIEAPYG